MIRVLTCAAALLVSSAVAGPAPDAALNPFSRLSPEGRDFIAGLRTKRQLASGEARPAPRALYFASFSMGEAGVRAAVRGAARFGIPVTLRGFVDNDLRKTAGLTFDLVKHGQAGGLNVDPVAFRRHGVTAVPALVVTCAAGSDRIAGGLPPAEMLVKVAEAGECADVARTLLAEAEARDER
nr:type-F conjugative transfer system pilin assembly protein TrbC [uncultured Pantoea sp.]